MTQVNISEACKLVKISRPNFYKNYIEKGLVTVTRDYKNSPQVDTAELMRVFGDLHIKNTNNVNDLHKVTHDSVNEIRWLNGIIEAKDDLIKAKDEQIESSKNNEQWLKKQVEELTSTVKLIAPVKSVAENITVNDQPVFDVKPEKRSLWPWVVAVVVCVCGIAILGVLYFPYSSKVPVPLPVQRPVPTPTPPAIPQPAPVEAIQPVVVPANKPDTGLMAN